MEEMLDTTTKAPLNSSKTINDLAKEFLFDLEGSFLEVVLIPAPDPRHYQHMVRAVQFQNCKLYRDFCAKYPRGNKKKASSIIKRDHTIKALHKIISGDLDDSIYVERLLSYLKEVKDDREARIKQKLSQDDSIWPF